MMKEKNTWTLSCTEDMFRDVVRSRFEVALSIFLDWSFKSDDYQKDFPFPKELEEKSGLIFFNDELFDVSIMSRYLDKKVEQYRRQNSDMLSKLSDKEYADALQKIIFEYGNVMLDDMFLHGNKQYYYDEVLSDSKENDNENIMSDISSEENQDMMDAFINEAISEDQIDLEKKEEMNKTEYDNENTEMTEEARAVMERYKDVLDN